MVCFGPHRREKNPSSNRIFQSEKTGMTKIDVCHAQIRRNILRARPILRCYRVYVNNLIYGNNMIITLVVNEN